MAEKRVILSRIASDAVIRMKFHMEMAQQVAQTAQATYVSMLDALGAEHDMTEQGTVEISDGLVTLVMPIPESVTTNGV